MFVSEPFHLSGMRCHTLAMPIEIRNGHLKASSHALVCVCTDLNFTVVVKHVDLDGRISRSSLGLLPILVRFRSIFDCLRNHLVEVPMHCLSYKSAELPTNLAPGFNVLFSVLLTECCNLLVGIQKCYLSLIIRHDNTFKRITLDVHLGEIIFPFIKAIDALELFDCLAANLHLGIIIFVCEMRDNTLKTFVLCNALQLYQTLASFLTTLFHKDSIPEWPPNSMLRLNFQIPVVNDFVRAALFAQIGVGECELL